MEEEIEIQRKRKKKKKKKKIQLIEEDIIEEIQIIKKLKKKI